MSYRPITDFWLLGRPKVKYYGAYPSGFLERARALLGVSITDPVGHICGGHAKSYPYYGYGPQDFTVDMAESCNPDYLHDVRQPMPFLVGMAKAIIVDPPYTAEDAQHYEPGSEAFPAPTKLLRECLSRVPVGGRVGMLHYICPRPHKTDKFVAAAGVLVGFDNRIRIYSVFERRI